MQPQYPMRFKHEFDAFYESIYNILIILVNCLW